MRIGRREGGSYTFLTGAPRGRINPAESAVSLAKNPDCLVVYGIPDGIGSDER